MTFTVLLCMAFILSKWVFSSILFMYILHFNVIKVFVATFMAVCTHQIVLCVEIAYAQASSCFM